MPKEEIKKWHVIGEWIDCFKFHGGLIMKRRGSNDFSPRGDDQKRCRVSWDTVPSIKKREGEDRERLVKCLKSYSEHERNMMLDIMSEAKKNRKIFYGPATNEDG